MNRVTRLDLEVLQGLANKKPYVNLVINSFGISLLLLISYLTVPMCNFFSIHDLGVLPTFLVKRLRIAPGFILLKSIT